MRLGERSDGMAGVVRIAALVAGFVAVAGHGHAAEFIVKESAAGGAVVTVDGQPFAEYVVDQGNKPYLWPIHGPGGPLMTRSWPMKDVPGEKHDHPHQRGVTFGHQGVNGIDTWAERASYEGNGAKVAEAVKRLGRIRHRGYLGLTGGAQGVIHAASDVLDGEGKPILADERRIVFSLAGDARVIDFDIDLVASHGRVTIADMKDAGLLIRVPESMTVDAKQGGTIVNSAGQRDADAWAKRATWCDYNGPVDGSRVGVAMLNHPSSFRHPTPWHVRTYGLFTANPFGLKALDPASESGEVTLEPGERISLRHRFIFHRGDEKEAGIAAAYESYAREPRPALGGDAKGGVTRLVASPPVTGRPDKSANSSAGPCSESPPPWDAEAVQVGQSTLPTPAACGQCPGSGRLEDRRDCTATGRTRLTRRLKIFRRP